jgi:hypothetical protein
MVSPLSIGLVTMASTICAYSAGAPRDFLTSSDSAASSGVSNRPGAMVLTAVAL